MLKVMPQEVPDDEDEALDLLESFRWDETPSCPYCGHDKVYRLDVKSVQRRRLKCSCCRRQFTVTKGTILEGSRLPLTTWAEALRVLCEADKPVTVSQLMREINVSYRAAQNIFDRINYAARSGPLAQAIRAEGL